MKSLYEVLDLPRTCTTEDIRKAYRNLAKTMHPDVGGDPDEFGRLSKANVILSDPDERAHYDATGKEGIPVDNIEQRGYEIILGAIADLIERTLDAPMFPDMRQTVLGMIASARSQVYDERSKHQKRHDRIEATAKRFVFKTSEPDKLAMRLKAMAEQMAGNIKVADAKMAEFDKATEILRDYDWKADNYQMAQMFQAQSAQPGSYLFGR